MEKIKSFTDLYAWQEGHKLTLSIYEITKNFPKEEMFGLTTQLRRAAVSFTSNIAEGFTRHSYKEKVQFYTISFGSLTEIQNQLLIAKDVGYINQDKFNSLAEQTITVSKIISGLIKKSKINTQDTRFKILNS